MSGSTGPLAADRHGPAKDNRWFGRAEGLSERESQVLVLCARGLRNREIADALYLNIETVKSHLKHAYSRLGIRNRAEATAYVVRFESDGPTSGLSTGHGGAADAPDAPSLATQLGLDGPALRQRRALLGLDANTRASLTRHGPLLGPHIPAVVDGLVSLWRAFEPTARYVGDDAVGQRLAEHQLRYLDDLIQGDFGDTHVEAMLRTGASHHRLGLEPQWYIATTAQLICAQLPLLFASLSTADAIDAVTALLASTCFDASLVLDAYELSVAFEVSANRPEGEADHSSEAPRDDAPSQNEPPPGAPRPISRLHLAANEARLRRRFIGIDDVVVRRLRDLGPVLDAAMVDVLDEFYALIADNAVLAPMVPDDVRERLMTEVQRHWMELVVTGFDEAHAASRMRVGVVHEKIGLTPQYYLAGLARQLIGVLRRLPDDGATPGRVDALVRAALYDATFVLDAYLNARAETLLHGAHYANHIVASLNTGVAVVDARDRLEYANEQLLSYVGVPAGVLHRMPVQDALPLAELPELLEKVRRAPSGRAFALVQMGGSTLRVTAIHLHRTMTGREGVVALVLDDLSEVLRATTALGRQHRTLDQVLHSLRAVVWEMTAATLTLLAVSPTVAALTGLQDAELLGRSRWVELIHPDDRDRFVAVCRALGDGQSTQVEHRLRTAQGVYRWIRTFLVASAGEDGTQLIGGVSVEAAPTAD